MTQETLDRLVHILDGIQANLESQSSQIKSLAELLRPLAISSTVQAPHEPIVKDETSCATTDISGLPGQANEQNREPMLPTPLTFFYPVGFKTKYALGELPLVYELQEEGWSPIRGKNWAYWKPVFSDNRLLGGRGQPSFVPEWEICSDNGKSYHIDDHERRHPLPDAPEPCGSPSPNTIELLIPYTCSLPPTNYNRCFPHKGLGDMYGLVRKALGNLSQIPSDGRFSLGTSGLHIGLSHEAKRKKSA
ncbi:hypothetical protein B0T20DRAFT_457236 [Sordaria brevicollis]|uniref:Uncharacterized protein n=1 Tax=Sordaria brevicollis TaxID=83679 RepID=A0AAE0U2M1_SORBR|nr:hypothetical protein B0T20DRAFT_457236 [Sordaria brevicollis]